MKPRALALAPLALALLLAIGCNEPRAAGRSPDTASAPLAPSPGPPRAADPAGAPATPDPDGASAASPAPVPDVDRSRYGWLTADLAVRRLDAVIPAPPHFRRIDQAPGSFGAFLRGLPLRPEGAEVHAHDGALLHPAGDPRIAAVVELDVGRRDLQQCADTALRLHAEWLWSRGDESALGYHFTSGDLATWPQHSAGDRPQVEGPRVRWARTAGKSSGRAAFRAWLDLVFTYAGTVSLARHAAPVAREALRPGDVFVLPGGPGHAILVLDVARDAQGRRVALLGQGFMPAQDAHVLRAQDGSPWFDLEVEAIDTPFWPVPFPWSSLRRMRSATGATE